MLGQRLSNEQSNVGPTKYVAVGPTLNQRLGFGWRMVNVLAGQLNIRNARIDGLEKRLAKLELDSDSQEQYTRRPNIRIQGMSEQGDGTTFDKILFLINNTIWD